MRKAKDYQNGGFVKGKKVDKKYITMRFNTADLKGDTVPAVLTPGEVVIPLSRVKLVSDFLKKKHIKLPNL
jgi:hypothetical protein